MADITITITADDDDLRAFVAHYVPLRGIDNLSHPVAKAIAAALPTPRIVVKPGMVLRRKSSGKRAFIHEGKETWYVALVEEQRYGCRGLVIDLRGDGLDPGEWEVLLDAEDGAS